MAAVIKIATAKAIKLLEDSIKAKKAEVVQYEKAVAQHEKDLAKWEADMVREARKNVNLLTAVPYKHYDGPKDTLRAHFYFVPSRKAPQAPTLVNNENVIRQSERLLQMLKLTDDTEINASVYKDLASLL